ncbi:hypothetical protein [Quisquiliibacterium transsilvanicum]|uniref:NnrS family protein n=1 Tax=Quisquiliibacterium transsilvanicum TaxID=1549638 RepID=A0A7W8HFP2_9BURK|nr:hypothetical protein [Quisquiliibacterium transsilvanicum]MBB5271130.1 hypothetical protein [Quisquiliibacterium transsilvanicum]
MFAFPTDNAGRTRLLPASIPFRFFAAASAFQLAAWLLLALADGLPEGGAGGLGPGVAVLHLFTLGSLAMTAIGASLQLLPVALVQSVRPPRLAAAVWWLLVPGVALLCAGMALRDPALAIAGALPVAVALALHAVLLVTLLVGAKRQRALTWHAWLALACLAATIVSGPALVLHYRLGWLADPGGVALAHLMLAGYGFMGLLATGFSYLLLPMFAVAKGPGEDLQRRVLAVLAASLLVGVVLALADVPRGWLAMPAASAAAAAAVHAWQLQRTLARRRNREGPWSRMLMRAGWICMLASLVVGAALAAGAGAVGTVGTVGTVGVVGATPARLGLVFVALMVPGWLLSFELAVLLRILPFLSAVHAKLRGGRMPALPAVVRPSLAWAVAGLHLAALALLLAGLSLGEEHAVRAAGISGAAGAAALLLFQASVWRRAGRQNADSLIADKDRGAGCR